MRPRDIPRHSAWRDTRCPLTDRGGVALIAALLLLALTSLVSVTVLQAISSEAFISGNFRASLASLYAAQAAIEEARSRLKGTTAGNPHFIGDPDVSPNPHWTAYIFTSKEWTPSLDATYSSLDTNYVPSVLQTDVNVQPNSLQNTLPYWAKVRQKTEFEAERLGHRPATPHYEDGDGDVSLHSVENPGQVLVYGYPTKEAPRAVQFTGTEAAMRRYSPVRLIQAYGESAHGAIRLDVEVVAAPGPKQVAMLYATASISVQANIDVVISGDDACRKVQPLHPTYSRSFNINGGPLPFAGSLPEPQQGTALMELDQEIDALNAWGVSFLTAANPVGAAGRYEKIFLTSARGEAGSVIELRDLVGHGILLVNGDLLVSGETEWNGLMLISGTMRVMGDGAGVNIRGAVWADEFQHLAGPLRMEYDSCHIRGALASLPLKIQHWREVT